MAVNAGAVATPEEFVLTVALPENVPLAPEPGAANVTEIPLAGFPNVSVTAACSAVANAVPTVALCGVPAVAAMANEGTKNGYAVTAEISGESTSVEVANWPSSV